MRPIKYIALGLLLIVAVIGRAEEAYRDIPAVSKGDIQFYVDHTAFRGPAGETYAEFYLLVFADQLSYTETDGRREAPFRVSTRISTSEGSCLFSDKWERNAIITRTETNVSNLAIHDQWGKLLAFGEYTCKVTIDDPQSKRSGETIFTLRVPRLDSHTSQIQFVSGVESGKKAEDAASPFLKNGRLVYPNPSRRYGLLNPILFLYYELYDLNKSKADSALIQYTMIDLQGKAVKDYPLKKIGIQGNDLSLIHGLSVRHVPSGIYTLQAVVSSPDGETLFSNSRRFEIIQPDYVKNQPVLDDNEIEVFDHLLRYLAAPRQYRQYARLDQSGKTRFIARYFRDRDPAPKTIKNEYLIQLQKRYRYANKNFAWGKRAGWDTDRGRILIKYGFPDEVKRYDFEEELNPHEIWYYHRQRPYQFVFGDLRDNGNEILLHSNAEEEVYDSNWRLKLKKTF